MHLDSLHLQGFRPYRDTIFTFKAGLNVVVANNGVGKTALIDAAAIALSALRGLEAPALQYRDLHATFDVVTTRARLVKLSAEVGGLTVLVDGTTDRDRTVRRLHTEVHRPTSAQLGAALTTRLDNGLGVPLMVRFGAHRAALEPGELTAPPWIAGEAPELGDGWSLPTDLGDRWLPTRDAWSMVAYGAAGGGRRDGATQAVIHLALQEALGAGPPEYSSDLLDFVIDIPGVGRRPVHLMSDGWRSTVALVVELAMRAAACWPGHADAGREAIGTVLIDELEQHLHPQLQREILGGLRQAFPKLQLIVTTHSPLVLTDALGPDDQIMLLEADDNGSPRVRLLDSVRGLDIEAIVTGPWFGLESTLDDQSLRLMADYRAAVRKREAGREERARLEGQLKALLAKFHPHGLEGLGIELAAEIEGRFGHQLRSWDDVQRVKQEVLRLIDAAVKG